MDRSLRRLDSLEAWEPPKERRSRSGLVSVIGVLGVVALIAVTVVYGPSPSHGGPAAQLPDAVVAGAPTHTHPGSLHRLLPAPLQSVRSSAYAFMSTSPGGRVTWEPCGPIHYVVHGAEEGAQLDAMFTRAVADVSRATGLKFVDDGATPELPLMTPSARLIYQPKRYGDRWAPVLVAWSDSSESGPALAGKEAGYGGADSWAPPGQPARYVSGSVAFNLPDLETMLTMPHGPALVRVVMLHELAHLVGLGHVNDRTQIMFPRVTGPIAGYQDGELTGLAMLGVGHCFPDY